MSTAPCAEVGMTFPADPRPNVPVDLVVVR